MLSPPPPTTATITPTMRAAARRIGQNKYHRGRKTWETPSAQDVAKDTVTKLVLANLAKVTHGNGRDRVRLTDLGREIAGLSKPAGEELVQ
ncbi:hypothetical protein [Aureimonas sp. SK2]|uniref:hypothetical protein n=1 Tax=Aureimonas sp. SK2 TaxID=3015992 RepID=UPI0024453874|nr:hypothetical protein [Aureimonas sp. SK2]